MGIFDSFSFPDAGSLLSGIKNTANAGLSALTPGSVKPGIPAAASKANGSAGYYKVYIVAQLPSGDEMRIVADGPQEYNYSTSLAYDTPYQELGEKLFDKAVSKLGPVGDVAKALIHGSGTRMFTQALTAKVWSGASETTISLPLIFQAETDAETDVLTPVMQLMFLSMPREATEGGFLSGPGPVFDWAASAQPKTNNPSAYVKPPDDEGGIFGLVGGAGKTVFETGMTAAGQGLAFDFRGAAKTTLDGSSKVLTGISSSLKKMVKYPISLQIGQGLRLDNVVVESVQQTQSLRPIGGAYNQSSGINNRVAVEVTFKTFYTLTQRDIAKMLLPMNIQGSKTMEMYKRHLGAG